MDAEQDRLANPFHMDEDCQNCPALADARDRVVHGYGEVGADFLFVAASPSEASEAAGVPLVGDTAGKRFQDILGRLGLNHSLPDSEAPELTNAYVTYLARCRHPERPPADEEVRACRAYLTAEIRMINPEVLVPVGQEPLSELAVEYTTDPADGFDVTTCHATTIRGRGFELVPMIHPADQSEAQADAFVDHFEALMARDYRQTKGRRKR